MSIPYFGKNGPITIQEIFDYYYDDYIKIKTDIINEPQTLTAPILEKDPSTLQDYIRCRDCCRKSVMGTRKSSCPSGYIPPLSKNCRPNYSQCLKTRAYPRPVVYPKWPWCCDPYVGPPMPLIVPPGGKRHNDPTFGGGETISPFVYDMETCMRRKGVTSTTSRERIDKELDECIKAIQKQWDDQKKKDDQCAADDENIRECIANCLTNQNDPCTTATQTQS